MTWEEDNKREYNDVFGIAPEKEANPYAKKYAPTGLSSNEELTLKSGVSPDINPEVAQRADNQRRRDEIGQLYTYAGKDNDISGIDLMGKAFKGNFGTIPSQQLNMVNQTVFDGKNELLLQAEKELADYGHANQVFANNLEEWDSDSAKKDPIGYIMNKNGLGKDVANMAGSGAVLLGEAVALSAATGGGSVMGAYNSAADALANVAATHKMEWLYKIATSKYAPFLLSRIAETPLEVASEWGAGYDNAIQEGKGRNQALSSANKNAAVQTVLLGLSNTLEAANLGSFAVGLGGKVGLAKLARGMLNVGANVVQQSWEEGMQQTSDEWSRDENRSITDVVNPFSWSEEAKQEAFSAAGPAALFGVAGGGLAANTQQKAGKYRNVKGHNAEALAALENNTYSWEEQSPSDTGSTYGNVVGRNSEALGALENNTYSLSSKDSSVGNVERKEGFNPNASYVGSIKTDDLSSAFGGNFDMGTSFNENQSANEGPRGDNIGGVLKESSGNADYDNNITKSAQRNGIPVPLLFGLIKQESAFDPNAESGAGAVGLGQLMPETAQELGVTDRTDPAQSIDGAARYLKKQYDYFGNWEDALRAYNWGAGNLEAYKKGEVTMPKETQNYVGAVMGNAEKAGLNTEGNENVDIDPESYLETEGDAWTRNSDSVSLKNTQNVTKQGLSVISNWYKTSFGKPLIVTSGNDSGGLHAEGNERTHGGGWKIDVSGGVLNNYEDRHKFIDYLESQGIRVIDEYEKPSANSTGGHLDLDFTDFRGDRDRRTYTPSDETSYIADINKVYDEDIANITATNRATPTTSEPTKKEESKKKETSNVVEGGPIPNEYGELPLSAKEFLREQARLQPENTEIKEIINAPVAATENDFTKIARKYGWVKGKTYSSFDTAEHPSSQKQAVQTTVPTVEAKPISEENVATKSAETEVEPPFVQQPKANEEMPIDKQRKRVTPEGQLFEISRKDLIKFGMDFMRNGRLAHYASLSDNVLNQAAESIKSKYAKAVEANDDHGAIFSAYTASHINNELAKRGLPQIDLDAPTETAVKSKAVRNSVWNDKTLKKQSVSKLERRVDTVTKLIANEQALAEQSATPEEKQIHESEVKKWTKEKENAERQLEKRNKNKEARENAKTKNNEQENGEQTEKDSVQNAESEQAKKSKSKHSNKKRNNKIDLSKKSKAQLLGDLMRTQDALKKNPNSKILKEVLQSINAEIISRENAKTGAKEVAEKQNDTKEEEKERGIEVPLTELTLERGEKQKAEAKPKQKAEPKPKKETLSKEEKYAKQMKEDGITIKAIERDIADLKKSLAEVKREQKKSNSARVQREIESINAQLAHAKTDLAIAKASKLYAQAAYHGSPYQFTKFLESATRSIEELKKEIKSGLGTVGEVKENEDNPNIIEATMPNGAKLFVDIQNQLVLTGKNLEEAQKAHNLEGKAIDIEGVFALSGDKKGNIVLSQKSRKGTFYHEVMHAARELALTKKENDALDDYYGKLVAKARDVSLESVLKGENRVYLEERIANAMKAWKLYKDKYNKSHGMFGKLMWKLNTFFNQMKAVLTGVENVYNVFNKVDSGEVWKDRKTTTQSAETAPSVPIIEAQPMYSARQKSSNADTTLKTKEVNELKRTSSAFGKVMDKVFGNGKKPSMRKQLLNQLVKVSRTPIVSGGMKGKKGTAKYIEKEKYIQTLHHAHFDVILTEVGKVLAKKLGIEDSNAGTFIGTYISNPTKAKAISPELMEKVQTAIGADVDLQSEIAKTQAMFMDYEKLSPAERVSDMTDKNPVIRKGDGGTFIQHYFNTAYPIEKDARNALRDGVEIEPENDFRHWNAMVKGTQKIASAFVKGTDRSIKAMEFIFPTVNFEGVHSIKSIMLNNGLYNNTKGQHTLSDYMVARQLLEMHDLNESAFEKEIEKLREQYEKEKKELSEDELNKYTEEAIQKYVLPDLDWEQLRAELEDTKKYPPNIVKAANEMSRLNDCMSEILVESGVKTQAQLDNQRHDYKHYAPLARVTDEGDITSYQDSTKARKGSLRDIIDPILSTSNTVGRSIDRAITNKAKQSIVDLAVSMDKATYLKFNEISKLKVREIERPSSDTVVVYVNGKPVYYQTTPEYKYYIDTIRNVKALNGAIEMLKVVADIQRKMFTSWNLGFAIKNPYRDVQDALFYSHGWDIAQMGRGLMAAITGKAIGWDNAMYSDWVAHGGGQGGSISVNAGYIEGEMEDVKSWDRSAHNILENLKHDIGKGADYLTYLGDASETMTRLAVYEKERARQFPKQQEKILNGRKLSSLPEEEQARINRLADSRAGMIAARASRGTMDFGQSGTKMKSWNQVVPFANAQAQDYWNLYVHSGLMDFNEGYEAKHQGNDKRAEAAFKEAREKMSSFTMKTLMWSILPTLLLFFWNKDDDRYKRLPQWEKDNYWVITNPWGVVKIPKGLNPATFYGSSVLERFLSYTYNKQKSAWQGKAGLVLGNIPSIFPSALMVVMEYMANYSLFLERNIVPQSEQGLLPEYQYDIKTTSLAKFLGRNTPLSPRKVDYFIKGVGGVPVLSVLNAYDKAKDINKYGVQEAFTDKWSDKVIVNNLLIDTEKSSQAVNDWYEELKEQNRYAVAFKKFKEKKPEFDPKRLAELKSIEPEMKSISETIKKIENNKDKDRSPRERQKMVAALRKRQDALANKVMNK